MKMINININKKLHGSIGNIDLDINLTIKKGEFLILTGKSGSGKTTLLRILAGLENAEGNIVVNNEIWQNNNFKLTVQKRKIGFVFQDYALFPNMTILNNLLFVDNNKKLANRLLELTELTELIDRYPDSLSGGQKQRVSLARAMMNKPKLLLMDEPLSALDPVMRNKLQNTILELHKEFNTTIIMVTHDLDEVYKLSTRVVEIENGKIINDSLSNKNLPNIDKNILTIKATILEFKFIDNTYIAVLSTNKQIIEIILKNSDKETLSIGDTIDISIDLINSKIKLC